MKVKQKNDFRKAKRNLSDRLMRYFSPLSNFYGIHLSHLTVKPLVEETGS